MDNELNGLFQHMVLEQEVEELRSKVNELRRSNRELLRQKQLNEALYLSILDAIPINIFLEDPQGHTLYANKQTCMAHGVEMDDLIGLTVHDFFPKEIADLNRKNDLEVWEQRKLITTEAPVNFKGEIRHMITGKTIISTNENSHEFLLGYGLDITDRVRAEQLLRESEEKFRSVIEQAVDSFFLIGSDGRFMEVNRAACELLEYTKEELLDMDTRSIFLNLPDKLKELATSNFEDKMFGKKMTIPVDTNIRLIHIGDQPIYFAFCRDIRAKKQAQAQIKYMAYHDALTNLPNRWYIRSYLQRYIDSSETNQAMLGFVLLDLDRFKVINDSLGHDAGDLLLGEVSRKLRKLTKSRTSELARLGGDEFVFIVPNLTSEEELIDFCEKIIEALAEPFTIYGQKVTITASIGVSLYPEHGDNLNLLFKNADIAMYGSKEQSRGRYSIYNPVMKQQANERLDLDILLRRALEENQFILHYQPKINLMTGTTDGFEALIRWKKKENQLFYPDSFIPVAEETGLIIPIGEWVILEACRQCREWHDAGFEHLSVSVNLSPKQFQKPDLGDFIITVLEETGLPPHALELELTESIVMQEPDKAVVVLKRLKDLGIKISIDDFGKGFSSLSYLRLFPIDKLKIDKSFIMNLEIDKANATIASAIIALAHNLDLKVVAEGVETNEQSQFLWNRACDFAQGYHISKPMWVEDVYNFLQQPGFSLTVPMESIFSAINTNS